jgi:hypothetical protein
MNGLEFVLVLLMESKKWRWIKRFLSWKDDSERMTLNGLISVLLFFFDVHKKVTHDENVESTIHLSYDQWKPLLVVLKPRVIERGGGLNVVSRRGWRLKNKSLGQNAGITSNQIVSRSSMLCCSGGWGIPWFFGEQNLKWTRTF